MKPSTTVTKPRPKKRSITTCIRLPADLHAYVVSEATRRQVSISVVLRDIVLEHRMLTRGVRVVEQPT